MSGTSMSPPPYKPDGVLSWRRRKSIQPPPKRWVRQTQRTLRRMASLLRFLLPCSAGVCLFVVGVYDAPKIWTWAVLRPGLQVQHIEVQGTKRAVPQEVLAYAGVDVGAPILALRLDDIALRLRQHPWVHAAVIRRQLPNQLHIDVQEHQPRLLVSLGDLYLANEKGQLFKRFEVHDQLSLPVVTGLDREHAAKHPDATQKRIAEALGLAQALTPYEKRVGRLEELHFDADLGWSATIMPVSATQADTSAVAWRAHLGHTPQARLEQLVSVIGILEKRGQQPDTLWVDNVRIPNRVQVELASPLETQAPANSKEPQSQTPKTNVRTKAARLSR